MALPRDQKLDEKATPQETPPILPPQVDLKDLQNDGGLYSAEQWQQIAASLQGKKNLKLRRYYDKKTSAVREKMRILEENEAKRALSETEKLELALKLPHSVVVDSNGMPHVIYKNKLIEIGSYAKVKVQQNPQTKKFDVVKITTKIDSTTQREDEFLLKVKLGHGSFRRDAKRSYLFMEYGGRDLFYILQDKIAKELKFSFEDRLNLAVKIFKTLHTLHTQYKILHRDIKRDNILYNETKKKISFIDYGYAVDLPNSGSYIDNEVVGTPDHIAPELLNTYTPTYTAYSDIYAAGVVAGDLFATLKSRDTYPFKYSILHHSDYSIESVRNNTHKKIQSYISNHLMAQNISSRKNTTQIIADLEKIKDEHIQELNQFCPNKKILQKIMDRLTLTQAEIDDEHKNEINLPDIKANPVAHAQLGLFKAPDIAGVQDEKKESAPVVLNLSLARPL